AYRRPGTAEEVERLAKLVDAAVTRGEPWEGAVQLAMQAGLLLPEVLFRAAPAAQPPLRPPPINGYPLPSRLSYFLWSSMPDDELLALAGKKQLTATLDAQVKRMLKDPRSNAIVENFALQWLQLQRLRSFAADPKMFPSFTEELKGSMLKET